MVRTSTLEDPIQTINEDLYSISTISKYFQYAQREMKINLWYCEHMKLWRWTLVDNRRTQIRQESGQREDLSTAMQDVANTVEYMMNTHRKA